MFLPYLWGIETYNRKAVGSYGKDGFYPTYEALKPDYSGLSFTF